MKFFKLFFVVALLCLAFAWSGDAKAYDAALTARFRGQILLQVQLHGEAWYVRPTDSLRYYMKDGPTAYQMMRNFGQGIADVDLAKIPSVADTTAMKAATSACASSALGNRFKGQIMLQVQQHGEAWYVDPGKCRRIYMADGAAAYQIMRYLGAGIATSDLEKIQAGTIGIVPPPTTTNPPTDTTTPAKVTCTTGSVTIPNYGDPGKRLTNCFVQYPGEPTRQDKSYYIVEDICGQFTKDFTQNALGMTIHKTEASTDYNDTYCKYYLSPGGTDGKYVKLTLNYSSAASRKSALQNQGMRVDTDSRIAMQNFEAWQGNVVKDVSLVLWNDKFISITQSSDDILVSDRMIQFGASLATGIKSYK